MNQELFTTFFKHEQNDLEIINYKNKKKNDPT